MRKSLLAAFLLACLSSAAATSAAWAQDATGAPAPLTQDRAPGTYTYQDEAPADDRTPSERTPSERAADDRAARDARAERRADEASAWQRRDLFCRRDAAGRTGYTTPRDEPARGAADAEADYGDAYHACMDTARDDDGREFDSRDRDDYAADAPPPATYRPYPYPYYYPSPRFYGPSFGFSFGIGPGYRGFYGPRRGYGRPYRGYGRR